MNSMGLSNSFLTNVQFFLCDNKFHESFIHKVNNALHFDQRYHLFQFKLFIVNCTHTHTHTHMYIYIFVKVFKHVWLKTVAILVLANFFSMPSIFLRLRLMLPGWQNNKFPMFIFLSFIKLKKVKDVSYTVCCTSSAKI